MNKRLKTKLKHFLVVNNHFETLLQRLRISKWQLTLIIIIIITNFFFLFSFLTKNNFYKGRTISPKVVVVQVILYCGHRSLSLKMNHFRCGLDTDNFEFAFFSFFFSFFQRILHCSWDMNSVFRLMNSNPHCSYTWITLCRRHCALFTGPTPLY